MVPVMCYGEMEYGICLEGFFEHLNSMLPNLWGLMILFMAVSVMLRLFVFITASPVIRLVGITPHNQREYKKAALIYGELLYEKLKMKFTEIVVTESHIYYRIAIVALHADGTFTHRLPHGTLVSDRIDDEAWRDLSAMANRLVRVHCQNNALWLSVHHEPDANEGYKPYLDILPEPQ